MLVRFMLLILAFMPFIGNVEGGVLDKIFVRKSATTLPMIRVLIINDKPGVVVEVKGKYKLYDPRTNEYLSTRFIGKRNYMQAITDGLKWGEEFPGLYQLLIVPDSRETTTLVDGIEYRGNIYVYDIGGTISVVNEPYIEEYLYSLLSTKYREPLSQETLAALAISARTDAYYAAMNPKNNYWDIDGSKIGYQGYAVIDGERPILAAVDFTRFLVMNDNQSNAHFPTRWEGEQGANDAKNAITSKISIAQGEAMAKSGSHAAEILGKAFPNTSISLKKQLE